MKRYVISYSRERNFKATHANGATKKACVFARLLGATLTKSPLMVEIAGREERSDGIAIEKQSRHILHSAFVEALKGKTLP